MHVNLHYDWYKENKVGKGVGNVIHDRYFTKKGVETSKSALSKRYPSIKEQYPENCQTVC